MLRNLLAVTALLVALPAAARPPVAARYPQTTTLHGEQRRDDYAWMRERDDPAVIAHLEAENRHTDAVMKPTEKLQEALYAEMLGRIQETDLSVPYRKRGYHYYSRTEKGLQYPIHARKQGNLEAPESVTLDLNRLAEGKKFMSVGEYEVSDDDRLLAYSTDDRGFRQYTLRIRDLGTGQDLPEAIPRVTTAAWAADGKTLFYATETEDSKRSNRVFRHVLGEPVEKDALVYEEKDEHFSVYVWRTADQKYVMLSIGSLTSGEVRVLPADRPTAEPMVLVARVPEVEVDADHGGGAFYIKIHDTGRNGRLVTVPDDDPRRERWTEIVPHREDVIVEGFKVFARHLVRAERSDAQPRLVVRELASGAEHVIDQPEPVHGVFFSANPEYDTGVLRFAYASFTTPMSVHDYDMATRQRTLLKQQPVLGGYDGSRYASERIHAVAADGTRIPVSVVYKKGTRRDGKSPCLLLGYGSYGAPMGVSFDSNRISYLDRGVIVALAHIRGGGDLGKRWHDEGRMMKKMNTFTDFIAVAEHLVKQRYTSRDRLVAVGGSAGGLLMGAVANLRPDLFKAIVAHVPFVDVLNTMLDPRLPLTVAEFEEWGNPKVKAQYDYIKQYSPYDNVAARRYPAMLVKTGLHDSQVMYWEPAKWVAKLRALKRDRNPLLLKVNMGAGHGGSSGRYDKLREIAFDAAFVLTQVGIRR
jgi:oligopeptidase B